MHNQNKKKNKKNNRKYKKIKKYFIFYMFDENKTKTKKNLMEIEIKTGIKKNLE